MRRRYSADEAGEIRPCPPQRYSVRLSKKLQALLQRYAQVLPTQIGSADVADDGRVMLSTALLETIIQDAIRYGETSEFGRLSRLNAAVWQKTGLPPQAVVNE